MRARWARPVRDGSGTRLSICLVNGVPAEVVCVNDRGLQYGDGLFETIAVRDGRPCRLDRHLSRLRDGSGRLGIAAPEDELWSREIAAVAGAGDAVVKLVLTRGASERGYRPLPGGEPTRICRRFDWPRYERDWHAIGVRIRWCVTRLALQPALAGCKHLNRLEQVLARAEWNDASVAEGLMLDMEGTVVSGTQSNLFLVQDGELLTAPIDRCGVRGVTRGAVLEQAGCEGVRVHERRLTPADLLAADEVFLTSTVIGAWPVVALQDRCWPVGPLTRRVQGWLAQC